MCIPLCIRDISLCMKWICQSHMYYTNFHHPSFFSAHILNSVFTIIYICCHYVCNLNFSPSPILFADVKERSFHMTLWGHMPFFSPHFDKKCHESWEEQQLEFKQPKAACDPTAGMLILKPRNSGQIHQLQFLSTQLTFRTTFAGWNECQVLNYR